jgi:phosphopantothenoylcysteine synthetase/decarboxylase
VDVDVVLTEAGAQFVGAATFQALTGRPVWQALWDSRMANGMAHIDLTRGADALLIAPATADVMAKLAHGLADDHSLPGARVVKESADVGSAPTQWAQLGQMGTTGPLAPKPATK